MNQIECYVCGRTLGVTVEHIYYETYCVECAKQGFGRARAYFKKHPVEAYQAAQAVLDSWSNDEGLMIRDILH